MTTDGIDKSDWTDFDHRFLASIRYYAERAGQSATVPYQEYLESLSYGEYLLTSLWIERAEWLKEQAGQRCQLCNNGGPLHLHHRTYPPRGYETDEDLIVLCADCHARFHGVETREN